MPRFSSYSPRFSFSRSAFPAWGLALTLGALLSLLFGTSICSKVEAQSAGGAGTYREIDLEPFSPVADHDGFLYIPGTRTPGPMRSHAVVHLETALRPLVLFTPEGRFPEVDMRLQGRLLFQLGLWGRFSATLEAPVILYQNQSPHLVDNYGSPSLQAQAMRAPRFSIKARLLGEDSTIDRARHEGEGLAFVGGITIPIGTFDAYSAESSTAIDGSFVFDFHIVDIGIGGLLGMRHRFAEPELFGASFRNQILFGVALQIPTFYFDNIVALLELRGFTDAENFFGNRVSTGLEWSFGLRALTFRDTWITGAIGTGLSDAVGVPSMRASISVEWAPREHDRDGDHFDDDIDECPSLPEDLDGFEDEDGCPEPDNDSDLVPDLDDRCPNDTAEFGLDADDDGCNDPQTDSDGDGIRDQEDACPSAAEDVDGVHDEDGCPEDDDQDGISDNVDQCRADPEDADGVLDADGCPEADGDRDGIPDEADQCKEEPETVNGLDDQDGCPDALPDGDNDGVPDAQDRCPNRPETMNGYRDEDGCPDRLPRARR